jgi:hypothetical protein
MISHDEMMGVIATEAVEAIGCSPLKSAALKLYLAGRWDCQTIPPEQAAVLWEALRDALGLPAGTATAAGVAKESL